MVRELTPEERDKARVAVKKLLEAPTSTLLSVRSKLLEGKLLLEGGNTTYIQMLDHALSLRGIIHRQGKSFV